ncbi:AMP-binding protein [Streptosporangium sp. NPDC002544]|uniref:AMP-binding protein n=1 Tax=unclassified Streptosporangium TaxID=2632669 RepID=UPI003319AE12
MTSPSAHHANYTPLTPLGFLRRAAEVYPQKHAIIYGRRIYRYCDFLRETERLARAIRAEIRPGDRVAFLAPNIPELLIAHFAVPLAGGVLVAINSRLAATEVQVILSHSAAAVLFVDAQLAGSVAEYAAELPSLTQIVEIPDPEFGLAESGLQYGQVSFDSFVERGVTSPNAGTDLLWDVDDEQSVISINYTSGTTGAPKGVMYTHRGAYLNALGEAHHTGLTSASVFLWTLPLFHCNGWCMAWAVTAAAGTHVCLRAVQSGPIWRAIDELGATHLCGSPTVCSTIADAPEAHTIERDLRLTVAGAPPTPTLLEQLESLRIQVVHVYGLTEVYGPYTVCEYQEEWDLLTPQLRAKKVARQGVAMVQADLARVVDENLVDTPRDGVTIGEVVLRGNNVMLGYFNDPEATEAAFAGGWFHTGDLGVMHADGYLEIKDRAKDIIISGGENISTVEVENAISSHPAVLDVAVVGYSSEKWGERPKAYVLLRPGHDADEEAIRNHARASIAGFKVPDHVVFLDQLPRTATGKVTKASLRARSDVPSR